MNDTSVQGTALRPANLAALFWSSFQVGLFSLGGGITAYFYREYVTRHAWMSEAQFFTTLSLARVLPGTNVSNFSVIAGYELRGIAGASISLTGLLLGPFCIILLLLQAYLFTRHPLVDAALGGIASAALGLIALMVYRSIRHLGRNWFGLAFAAMVAISIGVLGLPLGPTVLVAVPIALALVLLWGKKNAG